MAFFGTTVARGSAKGVVVATGMTTAIGGIAEVGQAIRRELSPLQLEINTLARTLTKLAGVIASSAQRYGDEQGDPLQRLRQSFDEGITSDRGDSYLVEIRGDQSALHVGSRRAYGRPCLS